MHRNSAKTKAPRTLALALPHARLSHPERVLYPKQGVSKADLAVYYAQVAPLMIPHLRGRPLMLVRCPEGEDKECFHQKHPSQGMSKAIHRVPIEEKSSTLDCMTVDDVEGLMGLVQLGALEIHCWGSRVEHIEQPDQLTFDLDPDVDLPWSAVLDAAGIVRAQLQSQGLECFVKTTGGKGLHLVAPLQPQLDWNEAKAFCKSLVEAIVRREPRRYLATMSKAKRTGKIFIDYLRNGRGATAICPYSTRAASRASVAAPIAWSELTREVRADHFDIFNIPERIVAWQEDPWARFFSVRQVIGT